MIASSHDENVAYKVTIAHANFITFSANRLPGLYIFYMLHSCIVHQITGLGQLHCGSLVYKMDGIIDCFIEVF